MNKKNISLTIDSRLENVPLVSTAINNICAQIPLPPKEAHAIELCVTEAVVNSIKHAYRNVPDNKVEIELSIDPKFIKIDVIDAGKSMNPALIEKKATEFKDYQQNNLEEVPSSGRGLLIIQSHMDSISYRIEKSRNTLSMTKNIIPSKEYGL